MFKKKLSTKTINLPSPSPPNKKAWKNNRQKTLQKYQTQYSFNIQYKINQNTKTKNTFEQNKKTFLEKHQTTAHQNRNTPRPLRPRSFNRHDAERAGAERTADAAAASSGSEGAEAEVAGFWGLRRQVPWF